MSKNDVDLSDPSGDCVGATARLFKASGEDGIWVGPHSNVFLVNDPQKAKAENIKKNNNKNVHQKNHDLRILSVLLKIAIQYHECVPF